MYSIRFELYNIIEMQSYSYSDGFAFHETCKLGVLKISGVFKTGKLCILKISGVLFSKLVKSVF